MASGARRAGTASSSTSSSSSAFAPEVRKLDVPCKFYREGRCAEGRRCRFQHVKPSSSSSAALAAGAPKDGPACRFFPLGTCKFGNRCALAHVRPEPQQQQRRQQQEAKKSFVVITPDGRRISMTQHPPVAAPAAALEKQLPPAGGTPGAAAGECGGAGRRHTFLASVLQGPPRNSADGGARGEEASEPTAAFANLSVVAEPAVGDPSSWPPQEDQSSFFAATIPAGYRRRTFCPRLCAGASGAIDDDGTPAAPVRSSPPQPASSFYSTVASKGIVEPSNGESAAAAASQVSRAVRTALPPPPPREGEEAEEDRANESRRDHAGETLECSICLESVLEKRQRFGLLDCAHCFCLPCIRDWRSGGSGAQVKSCPQCRVLTHFVVPSASWITDKEEKARLREEYKRNTSNIACKHYNYGEGSCPFGTSCHYAHINRDGTRQEVTLRKYVDENEDMHIMSAVRLSDFL